MQIKQFLLLKCVFLLILSVPLAGQADQDIDWFEEIDLLETELVKRHPDLFFHGDSAAFYRSMDRVIELSSQQGFFETTIQLQQVVAKLGDEHTQVNYHYLIDPGLILPFEAYWFEDGLFIMQTRKEYESILGSRILDINGFPLEQVADSLSTLLAAKHPSCIRDHVPRMLTWTQMLAYFGFGDTSAVAFLLEYPGGKKASYEVEPGHPKSEEVSVEAASIPLGWREQKLFFWHSYFPADQTYYIQYNKCWSREAEELYGSGASALFMPSFREFEKEVLKGIRRNKVSRLVLDLRFNGGGSSIQGSRLIQKIEGSRTGKNADIYLLVGRKTASSALINAVEFKEAFDAAVLGEDSGGKPNHFGEMERFVLPRTMLVINCATQYFQLVEGDPQALEPDKPVPMYFKDYMQGCDPVMEALY